MANILMKRGLYSALPQTAVDGTIYLTTDEGGLYVGVGTEMKRIGDYNVVASVAELPAGGAHANAMYYCEAENILARWNVDKWVQINKQPTVAEMKAALGLEDSFAELKGYTDTQVAAAMPNVYTGTDFDTIVAGITAPKKGDVVVVATTLAEGKEEKSAYQYDGTQWIACDGFVDADKVIMKENITMAGDYTAVGNLTKTKTGTATFETAGLSVSEALKKMLTKTLQPSKSEPGVTMTLNQAGAYEVGTKVTPTYTASLSAGSYTYGPATGITAKTWEITDTDGNKASTASGSFAEFTVEDGENYSITGKATYDAGAIAKDNMGGQSNPTVQIAAGSKSKTSSAITGYRSFFYGVLDTTTADAPLTSAIIRGMTNGGAYDATKSFTLNATSTAKRFVVAVPNNTTRSGLSSVILTSAMDTPITGSYVPGTATVDVEGVGGHTAIPYKVWVYEPASIDAGEVHAITLG